MRVLAVLLMLLPGFALADARATVLADVLKLREVAQILHNEGQDYAAQLDQDFLNGGGGAGWATQINRIYDVDRIANGMLEGLTGAMSDEERETSIAFFASDLGERIITLENSARVAMADESVETTVREAYAKLKEDPNKRLELVQGLIEAGDLINRNVSSALNSNYHFLRAMVDGDVYEMSEDQILSEVAGDRDEIAEDTESWLGAFMLMAYSPLSDDELEAYLRYSESPAGNALNAGFFAGFDPLYNDISYALGRIIALNLTAEEL